MKLFKPLFATVASFAMLGALAGPAYADVTLRFAIWDPNQKPAMDETMARFTELHPDIKVSIEVVPRADYVSKLETSIVGRNAPDVFWNALPDRFLDLARHGLIENLSERVKADNRFEPHRTGAARSLHHLRRLALCHPERFRHRRPLVQQGPLRRGRHCLSRRGRGPGRRCARPPSS